MHICVSFNKAWRGSLAVGADRNIPGGSGIQGQVWILGGLESRRGVVGDPGQFSVWRSGRAESLDR